MSQQTIDLLKSQNWEFKSGFAVPCVEFKSPRLKNFYLYPNEEFTEIQVREVELEAYLTERSFEFSRLCDEAGKEYIYKSRKILAKNGVIPDKLTIELKFNQ